MAHDVLRCPDMPFPRFSDGIPTHNILGTEPPIQRNRLKGIPILKVYLAGPEVFLPNATEIGDAKKKLCTEYGFEGLYPLDNKFNLDELTLTAMGITVYVGNRNLMRQANFSIHNLTPYHGPSADVGTAWEHGFMFGQGKIGLGYTNDPDDLIERIRRNTPVAWNEQRRRSFPENGFAIENFGMCDNLMIEGSARDAGFAILRYPATKETYYTDLTGFEACLKFARANREALAGADRRFAPGNYMARHTKGFRRSKRRVEW